MPRITSALLLGLSLLASPALAQFVPKVVEVPRSSAPSNIPSGLVVSCTPGPVTGAQSSTCPVVKWQGTTYWAFSYLDNRLSYGIVGYDAAGTIVFQTELPNDRYVYKITVDMTARTVTFRGQLDRATVMTWNQLQVPPKVVTVPTASAPGNIPSGLWVICPPGPDTGAPSSVCPVVQWQGITYWAYSYVDNRVSLGIVGYDSTGAIVYQAEAPGTRYVYQITVDPVAQTVTFWGQSSGTATLSWNQLQPPPQVALVPRSSAPVPPAGQWVICTLGPNTGAMSTTCPVVQWQGVTYWAFSFVDNRGAMGIVGYDANGNIVTQSERGGARYIYNITVDTVAQTVTFWGQGDARIILTWGQLETGS